jgi:Fe-S-cluster containining protein
MLKNVPELFEYDRGNGVCRYLTENNLCLIYSNRPTICNVEKMYDLYFKNTLLQKNYILGNLNACVKLANSAKNSTVYEQLKKIIAETEIVGRTE